MSDSRLIPPTRVDVVPASEVGALIEQTDREFVELEQRAHEARAQAEEHEALAAAEGIDPSSSTWTMVRLQRFLDGLRDEAHRDAAATVGVAEQQAKLRLEDARAEAERRRLGYLPDALVPPVQEPEPQPPVATVPPVVPIVERPTPVQAPPVVATVLEAPPSVPFAPAQNHTDLHAPDEARPTGPGAVALATETVTRVAPEPLPNEQISPAEHLFWGPPVDEPSPLDGAIAAPPAATAALSLGAPAPVAPEVETRTGTGKRPKTPKPAKTPKPKSPSLLRRLPVAAILEVLAVLLILVFILLRLS
jgi:hypothetical protein